MTGTRKPLQGAALAAAIRQAAGRATLTDRVYTALRRRTTPETLDAAAAFLLDEFSGDDELLAATREAVDILKGGAG